MFCNFSVVCLSDRKSPEPLHPRQRVWGKSVSCIHTNHTGNFFFGYINSILLYLQCFGVIFFPPGSRQAAVQRGWLCPGYLPVKRKFFLKAVTRRKLSDCLGFVTNIVRSLRQLLLLTSACTVKAMNVCCFEKHQHFSGVSEHLINRNFCSAWVTKTSSNTAAEMNASSVSVHVKVRFGWGWLLYSVSFVLICVMWEKYVRSNVKLKLHSQHAGEEESDT